MKYLSVLLICILSLAANGQCNCSVTLSKGTDGGIYAPDLSNVPPGGTVCIPAGTYSYISLGRLKGTQMAPVTVVNCGGQVISQGTGGYGYRIAKSQYFRITGFGVNGIFYGFKTQGIAPGTPSGISIMDSVSDYEVDHMEFTQVGVGVFTSYPPKNAEPGTWGQNWISKNMSFHDIYVHNGGGEAMYLGETSNSYMVLDLLGNLITVLPQLDSNVQVYRCIIDSVGWDGIQLASAPGSSIHDNFVFHYGLERKPSQQAGIIFGGRCSGTVYNNIVDSGSGNGLQLFGIDTIRAFGNLIRRAGADSGQQSVISNDIPTFDVKKAQVIIFKHNTIEYPNLAGNTPAIKLFNGNGYVGQHFVDSNTFCIPGAGSVINSPIITINAPGGSITGNVNACYALALDTTTIPRPVLPSFPLTVIQTREEIIIRSDKPYRLQFQKLLYDGRLTGSSRGFVNGIYRFQDRFAGFLRIVAESASGQQYIKTLKLIP